MPDQLRHDSNLEGHEREIARLNKIVRALMDRAERSAGVNCSDFSLFQTTILLEEQVRTRTAELEAALRENEKINRVLRESEAKFRGLVSQSLVGIVIVENGRFSYSNAKFNETYGYSADEIRGLAPADVAVPMDRPLVAENMRKLLNGEAARVTWVDSGRNRKVPARWPRHGGSACRSPSTAGPRGHRRGTAARRA